PYTFLSSILLQYFLSSSLIRRPSFRFILFPYTTLFRSLNVDFNIEVGDSTAIYWGKQLNSLADIINNIETFSNEYIQKLGNEAKQIIKQRYSWDLIINKYENLFLNKVK